MEVAEANLVQFQAAPVTPPQDDLRSDREQVLLTADGNVVVIGADECLVDRIMPRHVVCDLGDASDLASDAVDVDHTVIADVNHLHGTDTEREFRILFGDAIFEDLHGSVTEHIVLKPGNLRFCGWPEESTNAIAEDSKAGKAAPRIGAAVVASFMVLFVFLKFPIFLMVEVVEPSGEPIDGFPFVGATGTGKAIGDLLTREVRQ